MPLCHCANVLIILKLSLIFNYSALFNYSSISDEIYFLISARLSGKFLSGHVLFSDAGLTFCFVFGIQIGRCKMCFACVQECVREHERPTLSLTTCIPAYSYTVESYTNGGSYSNSASEFEYTVCAD